MLTIDWGDQRDWTEFVLNGKRLGDPVPGVDFRQFETAVCLPDGIAVHVDA